MLDSENPTDRIAGALCLAQLKAKEATAPLLRLLAHDDPVVRSAATRLLGDMGDPAVTPHLQRMLDDRHPQVRKNAEWALRKLSKKTTKPE